MNEVYRQNHRMLLASLLATLVISFTVPGTAFAVDRYYTGQACRSDHYNQYNFHSDGIDSASSNIDVACPIGGHQNLTVDFDSAIVWVYDANSFSNITCNMITIKTTGSVYIGSPVSSSGSSGRQAVSFTGSALPNNGDSTGDAINSYFECAIPTTGMNVRGYRVSNSNS